MAGVGGQGILSIATVIGDAALSEGLYLKQAEVHGMSQRGGDVQSNLRLSSEPIHSDLIPKGGADLIISLEPMEALRYMEYLKEGSFLEELDELNDKKSERVAFVEAIRRFIRMETITAPLLHELVDRIEVYETEGTGKNKTQRIVIYYRFVGNIEFPSDEENLKLDMRQGMAVEYLTA